jgi:ferric-dicitrate binding protein FerR (iron transport regulator)
MLSNPDSTLENLLQDPRFQRWVKKPSPSEEAYWSQWLLDHPDKREMVEQARIMLLSINAMQHVNMSDEDVQHEIQGILSQAAEDQGTRQRSGWVALGNRWMNAAASVIIMIGLIGWWTMSREKVSPESVNQPVATHAPGQPMLQVNHTTNPLVINLSDGSTIILQPNSQVSYPSVFSGSSREVYLTGEAFFEIKKDPTNPFFVHAQQVVTKVLGTSFYVKTDSLNQRVTVSVKTGKVSVYAVSAEMPLAQALEGSPDAVLSPNQQSVYEPAPQKPTKTVWRVTEGITQPIPDTHFAFESTPMPQVFASLEKAYGITIAYDREMLSQCSITASLTDEPLTTKLDLICKSVGLNYRMENSEVEITGQGCLQ